MKKGPKNWLFSTDTFPNSAPFDIDGHDDDDDNNVGDDDDDFGNVAMISVGLVIPGPTVWVTGHFSPDKTLPNSHTTVITLIIMMMMMMVMVVEVVTMVVTMIQLVLFSIVIIMNSWT